MRSALCFRFMLLKYSIIEFCCKIKTIISGIARKLVHLFFVVPMQEEQPYANTYREHDRGT